jgi:hypothetical protein
MLATCIGLQDPGGTISKSGRSAAGSLTEIDLSAAVTVPAGDAHYLTDFQFAAAAAAVGTIFRLYGRESSADDWTQIDDYEVTSGGIYSAALGTAHKFKATEQWKMTVQQTTIARCSVRVGGQAKGADVRDF